MGMNAFSNLKGKSLVEKQMKKMKKKRVEINKENHKEVEHISYYIPVYS